MVCRIPVEMAGRSEFGLTLMSDLHIGAASIDYSRIKEDLERAKSHGDYILFGGDVFDLILPADSKRYNPTAVHPRIRKREDGVNAVVDWAVELFAPYADRICFLGIGNHETSSIKHGSVDAVALLRQRLQAVAPSNHSIFYGGYGSFITFQISRSCSYTVFYWHGAGRGGSLQAGITDFSRKLWIEGVDAFWFGHHHSSLSAKIHRITTPEIGTSHTPTVREVRYIRTGSYFDVYAGQSQEHFAEHGRQSNYAADSLLFPHGTGGTRLVLQVSQPHKKRPSIRTRLEQW